MDNETAKYIASQNDPMEYRSEGQALDPNHPTNDSGEYQEALNLDEIENRDISTEIAHEVARLRFVGSDSYPAINIDYQEDGTVTLSDEYNHANVDLYTAQTRLASFADDISDDDFWHELQKDLDGSEL